MSQLRQKLAPAYRQKRYQMGFWWSLSRKLARVLVIVTMLALLLSQLIARSALPFLNDYKDDIAAKLSKTLRAQVEIESISSHFVYFVPYININGIRIAPQKNADDAPKLPALGQYIQQLSIGINPINMARANSWLPNDISITGTEVLIVKHRDGHFSLPGINPPRPNKDTDYEGLLKALRHKLIKVRDGAIKIYDSNSARSLKIAPISADYLSGKEQRQGYVSVHPAAQIGGKSHLRFDLKGHLRDPATWVGDVDLNISPINMQALLPYLPADLKIQSGHAGIALNASFDKSNIKKSQGQLDVKATLENGKTVRWQSPLHIQNRAADFNLRATEPLEFAEKRVAILTDAGVEANLSQPLQLGFYARALDIDAVAQLLTTSQALPIGTAAHLKKMRPKGDIGHFFMGWDAREGWILNAKVQNYHHQASGFVPGILAVKNQQGIDFDVNFRGGQLQVYFNNVDFNYVQPKLYDPIFKVRNLSALVVLSQNQGVWQLASESIHANIDQIRTTAALKLTFLKDSAPHLELSASAPQAPFTSVARYTPKVIGTVTKKWFDQAFLSGTIKDIAVKIKGDVRDIAHNGSATEFSARARAENAKFSFAPDWLPVEGAYAQFEMNQAHIRIQSQRASSHKLHIDNIEVELPDVRKASVQFKLTAKNQSLSQGFAYIADTAPLAQLLAPLYQNFHASGSADFALDFDMNISHQFAEHHPKIKGVVTFANAAALGMPAMALNLQNLKGAVEFSAQDLKARHIVGTVNGAPFDAYIDTIDQNHPEFAPSANIIVSSWLEPKAIFPNLNWLVDFIKKPSFWNTQIHFGLAHGARPAMLTVTSALYDSAVTLPAPFAKNPQEKQYFSFKLPLEAHDYRQRHGHLAELEYANQLQARLWFDTGFALQAVSAALGGNLLALPERGIAVNAKLGTVNLPDWQNYYQQWAGKDIGSGADALPIMRVALDVQRIQTQDHEFKNLSAQLLRADAQYFIDIKSPFLALSLASAVDLNLETPLSAHIQYLDLNALMGKKNAPKIQLNPQKIPPLNVRIDALKYQNIALHNINIKTEPSDTGLRLTELNLKDSQSQLFATGSWDWQAEKPQSRLQVKWYSDDLKADLQQLGFAGVINKGKARVDGDLSWAGALYDVDLPSLGGQLQLRATDGIIHTIKPKAGKLLGLINPNSLPKRLLGDFEDFSQSGLAFSNVEGDFVLKNGIANIANFAMQTDIGQVSVQGRLDLVNQTVNQIAALNLEALSVLPITAAAVAGVPGFVGAWLLERIIDSYGRKAEQIAQVRYTITGSWSDLQVEATQVKTVKELTLEEQQARLLRIQNQQSTSKPEE